MGGWAEWLKPKSNIQIILGLIFIIAGFVWMGCFFSFRLFSPSDRFSIWRGVVITSLLFFSGFCIGFKIPIKQSLIVALIFLGYSFVFFIPVPSGYEEVYYGGLWVLIMIMLVLYAKLKESKKKNQKRFNG